MRLGVWLFPAAPARRLVDAVVTAEKAGLDEIWIADEGVAREPSAVLAAAAGRTAHIRLATGITSPILRHPGAMAATAMTIDELSHGRAVLGLGVGGHLSLEPFGLQVDRPVGMLRDAIDTARSVLLAEPGPHYEPPDHAMPARDVPIWVGARGPQLVRTAAARVDGLFLSGCSRDQVVEIAGNAASVREVPIAVYQSATERPTRPSEHAWDRIADILAEMVATLEPAALGINLVESAAGADPVVLVERAAAALAPFR